MKKTFAILLLTTGLPALAEEKRDLDAHEHGVGELNIAFDGETVAMEFHAPGADIVGFEYEAESAEDRAAIEDAVATLARPLDMFGLPDAAGCTVVQASAELESEEAHEDEHGHDDHAHGDDHAAHDDHKDEHAGHDHGEDHKDEHAEHAHEDHEGEASHTEFHAEYTLNCSDPSAITEITFTYFDMFENALELEVQTVTAAGAQAFEVERDAPVLDLRSLF